MAKVRGFIILTTVCQRKTQKMKKSKMDPLITKSIKHKFQIILKGLMAILIKKII